MQLETLNPHDIKAMSYNELIGLVRETNRPPGGTSTISDVAKSCFLGPGRNVLEIGTATGIVALEIAQLTGCNITAIDINEASLAEATKKAIKGKVDHLIQFEKGDATNLSYQDDSFDVVFCGNVTSLVSDRERALKEYARVLKPGGLLAAVPMYYIQQPSEQLIRDVSNAIKVDIEPHDKAYWIDFFEDKNFKMLSCDDYAFKNIPEPKVKAFCKDILQREHLKDLSTATQETLNSQYSNYMNLFRVNLSHMGYSILVLTKVDPLIDRELFVGDLVK